MDYTELCMQGYCKQLSDTAHLGKAGAEGGCKEEDGPQALSLRSRPGSIHPAMGGACTLPTVNNSVSFRRPMSSPLALAFDCIGEACRDSRGDKLPGPS